MSALVCFIGLALGAAGLFISGAYLLAGTGAALVTAGACLALAAMLLSKGLVDG